MTLARAGAGRSLKNAAANDLYRSAIHAKPPKELAISRFRRFYLFRVSSNIFQFPALSLAASRIFDSLIFSVMGTCKAVSATKTSIGGSTEPTAPTAHS